MLRIGLTGGIGSGKTCVSGILKKLGVSIIDTDIISKSLTGKNGLALPAIVKAFGYQALTKNYSLNRNWMRDLIFSNPQEKILLESILHPLIRFKTQIEIDNISMKGYIVIVIPLLTEMFDFWKQIINRVCVIDCDPETQVLRVQYRSNLTQQLIKNIISTQAIRNDRLKFANDVIINNYLTSFEELKNKTKAYHWYWFNLAKNFLS
ncbi:MAG: dephospho-CoA kinase [Bordetella sp.]|nr:MAG: dephospho-CoA kinase [Bordetella sp.]